MSFWLRVLFAVLRFAAGLASVLLLSFALHAVLSSAFPHERFPTPFHERPGFWYLIPLAWAVLTTAGIFAVLLDYPKFRPWHRFDKALLAGFIIVMGPLVLVGLYDWSLPGEPVVEFFYARARPFESPNLNEALAIGFHVVTALLLCSFRWFMPNGPRLWPYGFLYRYVLVAVLIVPLYYYLFLIIIFVMG
ncbi:hypothetical protein [Minwuia sp.]|uniref:hypothetical protein n=1 Tax=Minwuia sp. TaxID=2493630 RepID=UPI003A9369D0